MENLKTNHNELQAKCKGYLEDFEEFEWSNFTHKKFAPFAPNIFSPTQTVTMVSPKSFL